MNAHHSLSVPLLIFRSRRIILNILLYVTSPTSLFLKPICSPQCLEARWSQAKKLNSLCVSTPWIKILQNYSKRFLKEKGKWTERVDRFSALSIFTSRRHQGFENVHEELYTCCPSSAQALWLPSHLSERPEGRLWVWGSKEIKKPLDWDFSPRSWWLVT